MMETLVVKGLIFRVSLYAPAEAQSRLSQAPMLDLFARIVNSFKLMLLPIFVKVYIIEGPSINL